MIIKSMSRKSPSFGQLVAYMQDMDKSDTQYNIYRNLYGRQLRDIENEFMSNADLVYKRKNGVYLYHEILSISKAKGISLSQQKAILRDLAYEYAQRRAPNNLIFGTLHDDHAEDGHIHYHFCISSNAVGERKKTRMSKAQFDQFKKGMEQRALEQYPELEQQVVINKQAGEKLSNKGAEVKRRTGKTTQRDAVKNKLTDIFATANTKHEFFTAMSEAGFETYIRGKAVGVVDAAHNRKHRLKTLGLLDAFDAMSKRIELDEAVTDQQEKATTYGQAQETKTPEIEGTESPQAKADDQAAKTEDADSVSTDTKQAEAVSEESPKKFAADEKENRAQRKASDEPSAKAEKNTDKPKTAKAPEKTVEEKPLSDVEQAQAKRKVEIEKMREDKQENSHEDKQSNKGKKP